MLIGYNFYGVAVFVNGEVSKLAFGREGEVMSNVDMRSHFIKLNYTNEDKFIEVQIPHNSGHVIMSRQLEVNISAGEVGAKERSSYDSYSYNDIASSSLSHIIRLRTGNVMFNYKYYNNQLRRTEDFENMALKITDLPVEALSQILSSVAKLLDGATEVAKSMTVCKRFLEASNSHIVFKVVCFRKVEVANRYHLFQQTEGLLYKCASVGNSLAQFLLAQVILKSSTQLKRVRINPSTLKNFREYSPRCNTSHSKFQEEYLSASLIASVAPGKGHRPLLYHWELVKLFLSDCDAAEIYNMHRDIQAYIEYFTGNHIRLGTDADVLLQSLHSMCDPELKYTSMMTFSGDYHFLHGDTSFAMRMLLGIESPTSSENVMGEQMRVKVLEAFDRVSCEFPGFVVPERED